MNFRSICITYSQREIPFNKQEDTNRRTHCPVSRESSAADSQGDRDKVLLKLRKCLSRFLPLTTGSFQLPGWKCEQPATTKQYLDSRLVSSCSCILQTQKEIWDMLVIYLKQIKTSMSTSQLLVIDISALLDMALLIDPWEQGGGGVSSQNEMSSMLFLP